MDKLKFIQEKKETAIQLESAADDMKRKGIITHQQCVAIKNNIYRWLFNAILEV
jgi:hypothetical protein